MIKAEIKDDVVINVIVVNPNNIPDWCKNWPTLTKGGIGWSWDGTTFKEPITIETNNTQ